MLNIAVLGTITRDTICYPDGRKIQSFGGILYNVLSLSFLGKKEIKVYPICNLGFDVYDSVLRILKKNKNIEVEGMKKVRRKNNHNLLLYDEKNNKKEISRNSVPQLTYSQIEPFLGCDVILVNFISGSDIHLKTLKNIRENTPALIFMDIHSLILGKRKDGKRFVKVPKNWRSLVSCANIVQCNFAEFSELSNKKVGSFAQIKNFAQSFFLSGPRILLVTKGKDNGYIFQVGERGIKANRTFVPRLEKVTDLTGCGDVFSAAFLISYLKSNDPLLSANFANSVATYKCRFSGIEKLSELPTC
jgi:sugar/nucleoside kinase (ribokinase family)